MLDSGRERQKKAIILTIFVLIIGFTISVVVNSHIPKNFEISTSTTIADEEKITETEAITGKNGEDNTLIQTKFKKVINGTELVVEHNERDIEVKLIGISVSEEKQSVVMDYLNKILSEEQIVYLQYDECQVNDKEQQLCYVWLKNTVSVDVNSDIEDNMLNALLIKNGLAEPVEEYPNSRYKIVFEILDKG